MHTHTHSHTHTHTHPGLCLGQLTLQHLGAELGVDSDAISNATRPAAKPGSELNVNRRMLSWGAILKV